MVLVEGHKYYYKLKNTDTSKAKSLLEEYEHKTYDLYSGIVVCRNFRGKNAQGLRLFAVFKNHMELYHHMQRVAQPVKSFFEVIFGHRSQKPHFDIDVDLSAGSINGEQLLREIVLAAIETLKDSGVTIDPSNDILIYTSSNETKLSYHIIINHWMHANNTEAGNFCINVRSKLREAYQQYIDPKVYSSLQQFRILWSNKIDSSRTKIPLKQLKLTEESSYTYPSFELEIDELLASLISNTTGCHILPVFINPTESFIIDTDGSVHTCDTLTSKKYLERDAKLTKNDAQLMLELLSRKMGFAPNSLAIKNYFTVRDYTTGIVSLTKKQRYKCVVCQRYHDNENPFLSVGANGTVRFHCRRADDSLVLGSLDHLIVQEESEEEEPTEEVMIPNIIISDTKKPIKIHALLKQYVKPRAEMKEKTDDSFLACCYNQHHIL